MRRALAVLALVAAAGAFVTPKALADQVKLKDGSVLEGAVVERGGQVVVRSAYGEVVVNKSDIVSIVWEKDLLDNFQERRARLARDDAEGRVALASWCLENGLKEEAKILLVEAVEIDPEHRRARGLLGQEKVDGRWLTEAQRMEAAGFVRFQAKWRTPEEVQALKKEAQEKALHAKLERERVRRERAEERARRRAERIAAYEEVARRRADERGYYGSYGGYTGYTSYYGPSYLYSGYGYPLIYSSAYRVGGAYCYPGYYYPTYPYCGSSGGLSVSGSFRRGGVTIRFGSR